MEELQAGSRLHEAILMAAKAHRGQLRKGNQTEYICHPLEVLELLTSMGADDNLKIAGVLHDTVEDTSLTMEQICQSFGEDVAQLVGSHTEDKTKSWKERKQATIDSLPKVSERVRMLILADKVANLRSLYSDYRIVGEELWDRFHAPKEEQCWYYREVSKQLESLGEQGDTKKVYEELMALYRQVFELTEC